MSRRKKRHKSEGGEPETPPSAPRHWNRPFAQALQGLRDRVPARPPEPQRSSPTADPRRERRTPPRATDAERKRGHPTPTQTSTTQRSTQPETYDYEDRVAWQQARTGVTPLSPKSSERLGAPDAKAWPDEGSRPAGTPPTTPGAEAEARARLASLVGGGVRFRVHREDDGYVEGSRVDAHPSVLRSVTRSGVAPEAEIDLHGMNADEAERALSRFVRSRHRAGDRLLLVVHGKGRHSAGGLGILADRTVHALTEGGAAPLVLSFASAPHRLGGTGAVVVQLVPR